jgi:hypothetical protein
MSTSVAVSDWIKRIADDERRRDSIRVKDREIAAHKADLVQRHGRRILDELRGAVTRDAAAFRDEFAGDVTRDIVVEVAAVDGGFAVRKPAPAATLLTVAPNADAAGFACCYRFTPAKGLPPREDRIEMTFAEEAGGALHVKHQGTGQVFATADALAEFLLVPVLTGRPR